MQDREAELQLRQHLKCSSCLNICPSINLLLCTKGGHTICATCKESNSIVYCPICNSGYEPHTRNFILENLTRTADMEFNCRNVTAGCDFVGQWNALLLQHHEMGCQFRSIPCPASSWCNVRVEVSNLLLHIQNAHTVWHEQDQSRCDGSYLLPGTNWGTCFHSYDGHLFLNRFTKVGSKYHAWAAILSDRETAEKYEVEITASGNGIMSRVTNRLHEIDREMIEIISEPKCFRLSESSIERMKIPASPAAKENGLNHKVAITFDIRRKSEPAAPEQNMMDQVTTAAAEASVPNTLLRRMAAVMRNLLFGC